MKAEEFRVEARAWLADQAGPYRAALGADNPSLVFADVSDTDHVERGRQWQRLVFAAGYAGVAWPVEYGGRGLDPEVAAVWTQEVAAAGLPPSISLIGEAMVGPALLAHGTEGQKRRWLEPILRADEIWCQLFSEPGAGSDLAAVATTAVRDGGTDNADWLVTGHKIWTSAAHYADYAILLARTDPTVPKHKGCTFFLLDMSVPGITVRPLRQMTGGAAFNEVLLDGARVPDSMRLGAVGEGWRVAMTTLMAERFNLGAGIARVGGGVQRLLDDLRPLGVADDPHVRQLAAQVWIDAQVSALMAERALQASLAGPGVTPGPDSGTARLAATRVSRRSDELLDAMRGAGAMVVDQYTAMQLWIPATRIAAGTEEVLKNVIAERVLGLPREPRP